MKSGIHPAYETAKITCACGRVTETRTTVGEIHVEICSHCHPFFTGRQKLVDTAGRVERFKAKYGSASAPQTREAAPAPPEAPAKAKKEAPAKEEAPVAEALPVADDDAPAAADAAPEEDAAEEEAES